MGRRETSWFDEMLESLKHTPVWVGPVVAGAAFLFFRYVIVLFMPTGNPGSADIGAAILRPLMPMFAWIIGGGILMAWLAAEMHKLRDRRLLDSRSDVQSLGDISWREFENMVSEAYRRQGYVSEVVGTAAGDGGVDIELTGLGELVLVQCKQWRAYKVGVTTIREMLGVVVSRRATRGIVVTSGRFTQEARRFATGNHPSIQLMDGPELFDLIQSVRRRPAATAIERPKVCGPADEGVSEPSPICPACGSTMVARVARRGANAGSGFWGCPKYPGCRGTRPINR